MKPNTKRVAQGAVKVGAMISGMGKRAKNKLNKIAEKMMFRSHRSKNY